MRTLLAVFVTLAASSALSAGAAPRIKDIVSVENVRANQLVGYGLVVGLAGTGDRLRNAPFTQEVAAIHAGAYGCECARHRPASPELRSGDGHGHPATLCTGGLDH